MSSKKEIIGNRCGVTLTSITTGDVTAATTYVVVSKWTPGNRTFDALAEAEAYFNAEVARTPQRPSLYGDRYKPTT